MDDMPTAGAAPTLVLLEGPSDVAAIEEVLARHLPEVPASAYRLVGMGGVTNTSAHLLAAQESGARTIGLMDAAEARFVVGALRRQGRAVAGVEDLSGHGFYLCERDLEDELIRALGVPRCLALLVDLGMAQRFEGFSAQRHWAGAPVRERLRRFAGIASGRKIELARAMAAALPPGGLPPPIAGLVAELAGTARRHGRPHHRAGTSP